jgi:hypothetical protein
MVMSMPSRWPSATLDNPIVSGVLMGWAYADGNQIRRMAKATARMTLLSLTSCEQESIRGAGAVQRFLPGEGERTFEAKGLPGMIRDRRHWESPEFDVATS